MNLIGTAMYLITYVVVPIVVGFLAAFRRITGRGSKRMKIGRAHHKGVIGLAMLVCGGLNLRDFLDVVSQLNVTGLALFTTALVSQFGIGLLAGFEWMGQFRAGAAERGASHRSRLHSMEVPFGFLAVVTGVAMLLVRARMFISIF